MSDRWVTWRDLRLVLERIKDTLHPLFCRERGCIYLFGRWQHPTSNRRKAS